MPNNQPQLFAAVGRVIYSAKIKNKMQVASCRRNKRGAAAGTAATCYF